MPCGSSKVYAGTCSLFIEKACVPFIHTIVRAAGFVIIKQYFEAIVWIIGTLKTVDPFP